MEARATLLPDRLRNIGRTVLAVLVCVRLDVETLPAVVARNVRELLIDPGVPIEHVAISASALGALRSVAPLEYHRRPLRFCCLKYPVESPAFGSAATSARTSFIPRSSAAG